MKKMLILFVVLMCLWFRAYCPAHKQLYILKTKEECLQLTWSNVDWWLKYYQVEFIPIVKAQIWLETGNLSSKYCRENNNLLGMKLPKRRQSTAIGRLDGMAYYSTWIHSIEDYSIWQKYFYKEGDYYKFLYGKGYAEDPYYIWKLKKLEKNIKIRL